jgi:hypothetical protein
LTRLARPPVSSWDNIASAAPNTPADTSTDQT